MSVSDVCDILELVIQSIGLLTGIYFNIKKK